MFLNFEQNLSSGGANWELQCKCQPTGYQVTRGNQKDDATERDSGGKQVTDQSGSSKSPQSAKTIDETHSSRGGALTES